jgi:hypothetical protein
VCVCVCLTATKSSSANWPLDHDDGSDHYTDRWNLLVHGGSKNLNGYGKQIYGNLFLRPDIGAGMRHCHNNFSPGTSAPRAFRESCEILPTPRIHHCSTLLVPRLLTPPPPPLLLPERAHQ